MCYDCDLVINVRRSEIQSAAAILYNTHKRSATSDEYLRSIRNDHGMNENNQQYQNRDHAIDYRVAPNGKENIQPCISRILLLVPDWNRLTFFKENFIPAIEPNCIRIYSKPDYRVSINHLARIGFAYETHDAIRFYRTGQPY